MNQLNLKQKIILGVVGAIIIICVGIYGYFSMQEEGEVELGEILTDGNSVNDIEGSNLASGNNEVREDVSETKNNEKVEEKKITIHITGEVKKSGVVLLKEGARIVDAIKAAGGETIEADLDEVNLAYKLEDGQKVYIPNKKEKNQEKEYVTSGSGNNVISQTKTSEGGNEKVNINEATQADLETLPGIGPSIASRIVEYRTKNGKFTKIEDLKNVKGIGDAKFESVKDYIVVK